MINSLYTIRLKSLALTLLIAFAIAILSSGCATTPMASSSQDAAAKLMMPPPEQSSIYIVRAGGFLGSAISFQVFVNGRLVGTIAPSTFHMVTLDPGEHSVSVISNENAENLNVTTNEGKNYFVEIRSRFGAATARASIRLLSDSEGRKMVQNANLAQALAQ